MTANEQRPSRSLRRRDRANSRRDAYACVPSPRYRDDDHGIEPGVHRWFGRECWSTGDRSELSCGRHRPAVGRQCLFASLGRAPFAGRSSGRPIRPPSSLDRRRSAVRHRFSGLRGGTDPYPVAVCSVRAGCERRNADAKQPRDPRPEFLWRGERPRDRHMGGDRSRCGRDRTCLWRVAHRCRQLAPCLFDQRSAVCSGDRAGVPATSTGTSTAQPAVSTG